MVIKVSNTNQPNWTEVKVNANLPENLHKLQEIAYNLWWYGTLKQRTFSAISIARLGKKHNPTLSYC